MYFGCNWSKALQNNIEKGSVKIDYIKSGAFGMFDDQFNIMRLLRPILIHGLGYYEYAGMRNFDVINFDYVNNLINKCNSPHYGLHLSISNSDLDFGMTAEDIHNHMSKQIKIFKESINVPLLLENTPDSPQDQVLFDHYPFILPEQINKIFDENDVSLLLDLTHAKITAQFRGWDIHDYIRQLPLDRVREIHVNGSGYDKSGFPVDTHQAMNDEDYALLDWVLNYTNPIIVTLEYNGIENETEETVTQLIEKQLSRIQKICNPS